MKSIEERLYELQDKKYRDFTIKLSPTVDPDTVIGVRLPALRALAKELRSNKAAEEFMAVLPHRFFEENHLHSFLLHDIRDFNEAVREVERFLPYVDNWAVCDSIRVKAFEKYPERLMPYIDKWIASDHTYTVRCGVLCMMTYLLNENFSAEQLEKAAVIQSDEYYINMMRAWYFATALAKQYEATLPFIENDRLDKWTHNKTIQKAVESYRVTDEHKAYLKTLRRKA